MRPDPSADRELLRAFRELVERIEASIRASGNDRLQLPVRMYVAGGVAAHFHTAGRMTDDVDATFSHRMLLPENLEIAFRAPDGRARLLYFDRQYNDSFGLLHEDAYQDSIPLELDGLDPSVVEVRVLSPTDLAVSKLARFAEHDQGDIAALAARGLLDAGALRARAEEALIGYVGDPAPLRNSISAACKMVAERSPRVLPGSG